MPENLTPEQIKKLQSLGIRIDADPSSPDKTKTPPTKTSHSPANPIVPLLSISGLTLLSFGGLVLFKTKNTASSTPPSIPLQPNTSTQNQQPTPTQVPKSIQHYLLASQQYFSQALNLQQSDPGNQNQLAELLNQSIISATQAIKEFPDDYRSYQQRGRIYQSLSDSKPEFLPQSIADLSKASELNPSSAELTRDLAALYAKSGDAQSTLLYLGKTVALEPTKAQNFYDLARIQQQTGLISQALDTYNRLLPLITDQNQISQIQTEKTTLENILAQNPQQNQTTPALPTLAPDTINLPDNPPTLQATDITNQGLIIAAPEDQKSVEVKNLVDTNSLSGESLLPAQTKEITLQNSQLSPESQVYVATLKGGKNLNLQVVSKTDTSFTIGLDSPASEDISFKWWIINNE
ncbi:MAG: tetratricopeptide repeat protein [Patescibacteria group bacterium]|jgi:hypothetical protein